MTVHGFIDDDKKAIDTYKKEHADEWLKILGTLDFDLVEDKSEWNESNNVVIEVEDGEE
jgi:hypothetical protein